MRTDQQFIDGAWRKTQNGQVIDIINPATEEPYATLHLGTAEDVDAAVAAARRAFRNYSRSSISERIELLRSVERVYLDRMADLAEAMTTEMGAPHGFANGPQVQTGLAHIRRMIAVLKEYSFEWRQKENGATIVREPIGVAGLITPWNWPVNQIACKVIPALGAGCTMVHKPSELSPISAIVWTEIMDAAGVPAGVFNMIQGDGATVGAAISSHPGVDFVHFTGSTRAGALVGAAAAATIKKVALELGGKSANIVLPDADLEKAVRGCVTKMMGNSGQSCAAPTRLLVHEDQCDEAERIAAGVCKDLKVGDPTRIDVNLGPLANRAQFEKVGRLINAGIEEGAKLVCGGPERPEGIDRGFFVQPTVFGRVARDMTIAREEIFGPVLVIMPYTDEEEALEIANSGEYGLAGFVQSGDPERARAVAARLEAGRIEINYPVWDDAAPFGGYKRSGLGREYGRWGLEEFLEVKAIIGGRSETRIND